MDSSRYSSMKPSFPDPAVYTTTSRDTEKRISRWPTDPRTLKESAPSWAARVVPHAILLLIPLGFIGLAIAVLRLNGREESPSGNAILQAMAVTATLWPILFAAVLGPLVKAIMLYGAQRGTTIGVLEFLHTSQTLVSTVRGCFTLRILSIWPVAFVAIWLLSPVGGQGALRAMTLRTETAVSSYALSSFPSSNVSVFSGGPFNAGASGGASLMNQYQTPAWAAFGTRDLGLHHANGSSNDFETVLQQAGGIEVAVSMTQRDLWRNVRLPFLRSLPGYTTGTDDWVPVSSDTIPNYSSLIGFPTRGFPAVRSGNTSFTMEASYQTVECNQQWMAAADVRNRYNGSFQFTSSDKTFGTGAGLPNLMLNMIVDPKRESARLGKEPPAKLRLTIGTYRNLTICEVSTEYVNARVRCSRAAENADLACYVESMRHDPQYRDAGNLTALDIGRTSTVLQHIPYTLASTHAGEASILEKWLKNPPQAFNTTWYLNAMNAEFIWADVPLNVFADRFAMALNTHLRASLEMSYIVGSDGLSVKNATNSWAQTDATWTEFKEPIYHLHNIWFILYLVSAIVLAVCALANILLRTIIYIPDFLSNISALTRDSVFVDVDSPASTLDGTDRSRLLQRKRVMVQDVRPHDTVGRIAFSDAPEFSALRKDRLYI